MGQVRPSGPITAVACIEMPPRGSGPNSIAVAPCLARQRAAQGGKLWAQRVGHGGQAQCVANGFGALPDDAGGAHALAGQGLQFAPGRLFRCEAAQRQARFPWAAGAVEVDLARAQFGAFLVQCVLVVEAPHVDHPAAGHEGRLQRPTARGQAGGGGAQGVGLLLVEYAGAQAFGAGVGGLARGGAGGPPAARWGSGRSCQGRVAGFAASRGGSAGACAGARSALRGPDPRGAAGPATRPGSRRWPAAARSRQDAAWCWALGSAIHSHTSRTLMSALVMACMPLAVCTSSAPSSATPYAVPLRPSLSVTARPCSRSRGA